MYSIIEQLEKAEGVLSVKQVADILGVMPQTIYKMANNKKLPGIQVNAKWIFDPKTIAAWVLRQNPTFIKAASAGA